jgi:hypothetical protein
VIQAPSLHDNRTIKHDKRTINSVPRIMILHGLYFGNVNVHQASAPIDDFFRAREIFPIHFPVALH